MSVGALEVSSRTVPSNLVVFITHLYADAALLFEVGKVSCLARYAG